MYNLGIRSLYSLKCTREHIFSNLFFCYFFLNAIDKMEDKPDILKALNTVKSEQVVTEMGIVKRKSLEDLIKEDARSPVPGSTTTFPGKFPFQNS